MKLKMMDKESLWRKWHKWIRKQERTWGLKRKMMMISSSTFRNFLESISLRSMGQRKKSKI
jgi:hypothetical protein